MNAILLRGQDHTTFGEVAEVGDDRLGAAISRGGAAKPYPHADPNEDVALGACAGPGALVAVADGHWGHRAAEAAVAQLRDAHLEDWVAGPPRAADRWYQDWLHALVDANDAILAAHTGESKPRTTLALALARTGDELLVTASVGDSHLFLATIDGEITELLPRPRKQVFLGHERWTVSQIEKHARFDVRPLESALAIVAVTDGLSEGGIGVDDPAEAVRIALACAREQAAGPAARAAARGVVDAALAAHIAHRAGDNVAAAVVWLAD